MTYGVSVAYFYTEPIDPWGGTAGVEIRPAYETMEVDFRPNTASGLRTIEKMLRDKHEHCVSIAIFNLIPLELERRKDIREHDLE